MLGFGLFGCFNCKFAVSRQMLGESREIEAKPSQKSLHKRPNRPKTKDPRKNPQTKMKHKCSVPEAMKLRRPEANTASPWWLPQSWRPPSPSGCFSLWRLFIFLRSFLVCPAIWSLKEGCIWLYSE